MEFNPTYVYFEPIADMTGLWCIASDSVFSIKSVLKEDDNFIKRQLVQIKETLIASSFPFRTTNNNPDGTVEETNWKFVYIDPAFQDMMRDEKVLEWTDLKIGDVITYIPNRDRYMMVTRIDKSADTSEHIFAGSWLSNDDLADWEKVEG